MKKALSIAIVTILILIAAIPAFAATQSAAKSTTETVIDTFTATVTHLDVAYKRGTGRQYVVSYSGDTYSGTLDVDEDIFARLSVGDTIKIWHRDDKGIVGNSIFGLVSEHSTDCYVTDVVKNGRKYFVTLSTGENIRVTHGTLYKFNIGDDYAGNYNFGKEVFKETIIWVLAVLFIIGFAVFGLWIMEVAS